ncbi:MAG: transposase [Chloroflexota bacterium]|nr:transposase [Chloroflexota bacterium]
MSLARGHAHELLSKGLAAAQSGDRRDWSEAEHYLEWVTLTDADLDQQAQAWYWLSRVTDDPQRKAECLENALSIQPGHADARRDKAILDGRLDPTRMRGNAAQSAAPTSQPEQISSLEGKRFPCPKCGAVARYDPMVGTLRCQFCGAKLDASGQVVEDATSGVGAEVSEQDWVSAIYTEEGHAWVLPQQRLLQCRGCGAEVTFAPARVSARCAYCGSPYVVVEAAGSRNDLREPDGIVPFTFDPHAALGYAQHWLSEQARLMGVPDDLPRVATMYVPQPVYLPFWTFDIVGEVRWSGWIRADQDFQELDNVDMMVALGGMALGMSLGSFSMAADSAADAVARRQQNKNNLVHSSGAVGTIVTDVLVPASRSLPPEMFRGIHYHLPYAQRYSPEMLVNWPAEIYSVSLADASLAARQSAVEESNKQVALETGVEMDGSNRSISVDRSGLSVQSYKLLLLPVYTTAYTYRDRTFRLVVNGQTGQVLGDVPGGNSFVRKMLGS